MVRRASLLTVALGFAVLVLPAVEVYDEALQREHGKRFAPDPGWNGLR